MFNSTEENDSNSNRPTSFDFERLKSMEIGESVNGELGNWKVIRYKKDYVLILENDVDKTSFQEFDSLSSLLKFINT